MTNVTMKFDSFEPATETAADLFDSWFDPIESGVGERVSRVHRGAYLQRAGCGLARPRKEETARSSCDSDGCRIGLYKPYREPRRRGYDDDDYTPRERAAEKRSSNSRPSAFQASEPVAAIVK
jgi:hypothetical protein